MKQRNKFILYLVNLSLCLCVANLLWSCSEHTDRNISINPEVEFLCNFKDSYKVSTRFDSSFVNNSDFGVDFYIKEVAGDKVEYGVYEIPSGYEGRLGVKDSQQPLNWFDLDSPHIFYGWTIPWNLPGYNPESETTVPIEFLNSSEESGYKINKNNQILEKFIGAASGPYVYKEHGRYVELTFFHLVSKIKINSLSLVESDGSIQKHLKADVTFVNMPTTATFHPFPESPDGKPQRPYVEPGEANKDDGITYYISNDYVDSDLFYVCPEVNFRDIEFKIVLNNTEYADYKTYYGTFNDVVFERQNVDHDSPEGNDTTILHAGEMMSVDIVLIPGIGPGLRLIIQDWSTDEPRDAQYHTYPGLYSEEDLNALRDLFMQLMSPDDQDILDKIKDMYDIYGAEIDGKKSLKLFNNIDLTTDKDGNIFPVWKDYILDGLGHMVRMKTNNGSFWGGSVPYYNIGPCRNIYFTDPNGNNTIYIDEQGYVWVTDKETGELVKTANQLQDLNTYENGKFNSYDINAETGEIRYSTYFNNHITG